MHGVEATPLPSRSLLCSALIGRQAERRALASTVERAARAGGGVVFVAGEAGIGKSRLAREAVALARGMPVLRGRAVETASPVAYRPLAEALCSATRDRGLPDAPELAPFRPALGRLIPEWRAATLETADDSSVLVGEAVLRFLRVVAENTGCLVVLEDLHWSDPETLGILEYLADNVGSEPVAVVATLRVEDPTPALALARSLEARRVSEVLTLGHLDHAEVGEMVRDCLDAKELDDEVLALTARADGIPFLVEELLASTVTAGALVEEDGSWTFAESLEPVVPLTFADSVRRRLTTLGEEARAVLGAAAVLGRRFDWELLPAIVSMDRESVLDALRAAVDAQLVAVDPERAGFRFRHALTRDAVLRDLLPPARAELSSRALDAIEAVHPGLPGEWCEVSGELAEAAGDRPRAAALLLVAGRRALEQGALATAEATVGRARALAPAGSELLVDVEECLTNVLSLAGKRDQAFEVGDAMLDRLGDEPAVAARRAEIRLALARAAVAAGQWSEGRRRVDAARRDAASLQDDRIAARADALAAHVEMGASNAHEAEMLARAALDAAERTEQPVVACEALEVIGRCARPRDLDEAEAAFARAYALADGEGLTVWRGRALHELGTIDLLAGGDTKRLEVARALAEASGALATTAVLDVQITAVMMIRGEFDRMLASARRAATLARKYRLEQTYAAAQAFEGHVHGLEHRPHEMEQCYREAEAHAAGDPAIKTILWTGRALAALATEDRAAARQDLERAVELSWEQPGDQSTGPSPGMWALLRVLDDPGADVAFPNAPVWWKPIHFVARRYGELAEAVIAGRRGSPETAQNLTAAADRGLAGGPWFRYLGRRLVAEAALADGWGDPVSWLRDALAFFEPRGEDEVSSACRSFLRRAGERVPRRSREDVDAPRTLLAMGVTAREVEVLRLLADGLPNKAIAARLFLSPRTVERHIANVGVKVGAETRSQLVALAARSFAETSDGR